jgi:hypothetical protein
METPQPREYNKGDKYYLTEGQHIQGITFRQGDLCEIEGLMHGRPYEGKIGIWMPDRSRTRANGEFERVKRRVTKEFLDEHCMPERREGNPMPDGRAEEIRNADDWEKIVRKSDVNEGSRMMRAAFERTLGE